MSDTIAPDQIFTCQKCGECCRGYGGTFISQGDIARISNYLNIDPDRFMSEFCQLSGGKPLLAQHRNGYCVFWDKLCTIHPVKPKMCKEWPFIESLIVDVNNWQMMASICPGVRTDLPDRLVKDIVNTVLSKGDYLKKSSSKG
jgi:Fe-S-cluster containining protein